MRRMWPLTLRGTGALVLSVACFILVGQLGVSALVYFGLLLLAMLLFSMLSLWMTHRAESVNRTLSNAVAAVGRSCAVTLRVAMRTTGSPAVWRDEVPAALSGDAQGEVPASAPRDGVRSVELSYSITGVHRGVHALGPLSLIATDPFGLVRRRQVVAGHTPVTVVPALVDLPPLPGIVAAAGGTQSVTDQLGQGADNLIPRPYAPGDSMRRVHWRATAHRGEIMVRQEEQEATPAATVVFDRAAARWGAGVAEDAAFEAAVVACVSIAWRLVRDGFTVEVIDPDGTPLAELADADGERLEHMLVLFATVAVLHEDRLARLPELLGGVTTGPLVIVTGRFGADEAELLASVAHHSSLPVLLTAHASADAAGRAEAAGWRVLPTTQEELSGAWSELAEERHVGI